MINPLLDQDEHFYTQINSQYYDISEFNRISHNKEASFSLIHTNLASITKHHDDLQLTLSLLKTKFDVIGVLLSIKLKKSLTPQSRILIYQVINLLSLIVLIHHMAEQDFS